MVRITAVRFPTLDPAALRPFYTETLGLPLLDAEPDRFSVRAGATRLTFVAAPGPLPAHHFAFNIPRNLFPVAKAWLATRAALLTQDGQDEFDSASWRSRQIYFRDPAGNILELIARQDVPLEGTVPFGPEGLLNVSEVGLPVAAVPATVAALKRDLALPPYGTGNDTFAPVGDETGLLIVVQEGRHWFPTATPADPVPLAITLIGDNARTYTPPGTPHTITVVPAEGA